MYWFTYSWPRQYLGVNDQVHASAALSPEERAPDTHWVGGWIGFTVGLNFMEKRKILPLPRLEIRPLGRPARSQSLYPLSYPGTPICYVISNDEWIINGWGAVGGMRIDRGSWSTRRNPTSMQLCPLKMPDDFDLSRQVTGNLATDCWNLCSMEG
jgi:hypothetical protein